MIGRGAFGNPWIFREARALIDGAPVPAAPDVQERFEAALEHARMVQEYEHDPAGAAIEFRKHLGWYVQRTAELGVAAQAAARREVVRRSGRDLPRLSRERLDAPKLRARARHRSTDELPDAVEPAA